jgi:zinc transport system substrate-binding protein
MNICVRIALVIGAFATGIPGCGRVESPLERTVPLVYTTFYPTTYFAQRIGGAWVRVVCPVPAHADPSFWMPDAAAIQAYQGVDLILVNGAEYEKWLNKVSLPPSKVVETTYPFRKDLLRYAEAITHSHGPGGMHSHEGTDGHTWLDPQNALIQAGQVHQALARLLPSHVAELQANFDALAADLRALDHAMQEVSRTMGEQRLLASHPAYNYLARRYGWKVSNLSLDPEKLPGQEALAKVRTLLKGKPVRIVLWESQPRAEVAKFFEKELGLQTVVFSPCETPPASGDYLAIMNRNVQHLREAIRP